MRFALRNQQKIDDTIGAGCSANLLGILKKHFALNSFNSSHAENYSTLVIVDDAVTYEFYIIRRTFNVYTLAFKHTNK